MDERRHLKRKQKALNDGNREQLAVCCQALADYYNEQGRYEDAAREYQQEAEIYAKLHNRLATARAQRMVGEMHMLLSQFDSAKEHIKLYLNTAKQLENKVEEQRAYVTLGRAHLLHSQSCIESGGGGSKMLAELRQAERAFLRSLLLIKELNGQISKLEQLDMQARCYLNIGVVKEHMEQFDESIGYIEKAIAISKTHDIFELTHMCYISMSLLYHSKQSNATLALRYCNQALEVAKRLPNKVKKICETLITKAEILIRAGDFASAKQILTKAYKKNTPDGNDRAAIEKSLRIVVKICQILDQLVTVSSVDFMKRKTLYEQLGDGCCQLQNYKKALEYYHEMLESAELAGETGQALIPIYVSLYQTYKDDRQYERAIEFLWKEFEVNKDVPEEACSTLCGIAEVYELQQQPFWTVQDVYLRAKEEAAKVAAGAAKTKLEKVVYARLKRLQLKHDMHLLAEDLTEEARGKGIDLDAADEEESDGDGELVAQADCEQNTPQLGDDVCLDELTDSDMSDLDETEKPRAHRVTRGTRALTIKRNNKGETQLHQACIAGNVALVRRLLEQGHVVNVRDHAGWIPLHEACNHGYYEIVQLLLDKGGTVAINDKGGTSCDGITPLYDACANGYLDVVELLLERGADATVKTDFGETCVEGLDKWRRTATLTDGEQAQYASVRTALLRPLSKLGIAKHTQVKPLTNANRQTTARHRSNAALIDDEDDDGGSGGEVDATAHARRDRVERRSHGTNKITTITTTTASVEYRNVMEQLKRPNRLSSSDSDVSAVAAAKQQKRTALLCTEEVDDDDWLVNDVGPEKKKRCFVMPTVDAAATTTTTSSNNNTPAASPAARKSASKENLQEVATSSSSTWLDDCLEMTPEATTDAFQVLLETGGGSASSTSRRRDMRKLQLSRSSSVSSHGSATRLQSKPKYQASLLDSGFSRFRSESPACSEDSMDNVSVASYTRSTEPDSTTTTTASQETTTAVKTTTAPVLATTVSFKVKVEDELLLVPIERRKLHEINMRWLAEEAARRYYNLVGLRPVLRLKTADGFAYEELDAVNVALEQSMILAAVVEWQISPLVQRYGEMCQLLKREPNAEVQSALERAQSSNVIRLPDLWLTPPYTEPIFKALLHQNKLRVLDLSHNFMQDDGCRQLAKSLPTLKQLQVLNLTSNFITVAGLEAMCALNDPLPELEELNLSNNPLGDACVRVLASLCEKSTGKTLQKLALSHCDLTHLPGQHDLCYDRLTAFDVSFNQLDDQSMRTLLTKLNACRLQLLNFTYAATGRTHADQFAAFFESGTCAQFKRIAMGGCGLNDAAVYRIVQCLSTAGDLELIDVSDNQQLAESLLYIVEKLPQLRQLIAVNCNRLVNGERVQRIAQLEHMPKLMSLTLHEGAADVDAVTQQLCTLWQTHWGDRSRVERCERVNHLLLHTTDKDAHFATTLFS